MAKKPDINPISGLALIEPMLHSKMSTQALQKQLKDFQLAKPEFEGVPAAGVIYALPSGYENEFIKVGANVIFSEKKPKGFRHNNIVLFPIKITDIAGVIL